MRYLLHIILLSAILVAVTCCTKQRAAGRETEFGDTLYTAQAAMNVYAEQPERALQIIDTGELVGNIPPHLANFLRARIYTYTSSAMNLDTARQICEALTQEDQFETDKGFKFDVLELLVYNSKQRCDDEGVMKWGPQLVDHCQEQGETVEALRTTAEIGTALTNIGNREEGLELLDDAIRQLEPLRQFNPMDAFIIVSKRKIVILSAAKRYNDIIPLAQGIIDKLDDFEQHNALYNDSSYRMPAADQLQGYIDCYRAQAYAFMAYAYACMDDMKNSRRYSNLFESSDYSKTFAGRGMIAPTWQAQGKFDKMLAAYDELAAAYGKDTINKECVEMLRGRAMAAAARGQNAESQEYWKRYAHLSDTLNSIKQMSKAHEYAARYHAQEQEMALQYSEAHSARLRTYIIFFVMIALIAACFAAYFFAQRRIIAMKNRVLIGQIAAAVESNQKYLNALEAASAATTPTTLPQPSETPVDTAASPDATTLPQREKPHVNDIKSLDSSELFNFLSDEIQRRQLYLDPTFGRQTLVEAYHISERAIGAAFSHSGYKSMPDFIRTCRLRHACQLLRNAPEMNISDVATASGFSNLSVFSRDFKREYTVTPSVYREQNPLNA